MQCSRLELEHSITATACACSLFCATLPVLLTCIRGCLVLLSQACVRTACLLTLAFFLLQTAEFDIKKEAAWAISNATSGGTAEQIKWVSTGDRLVVQVVLCSLYLLVGARL